MMLNMTTHAALAYPERDTYAACMTVMGKATGTREWTAALRARRAYLRKNQEQVAADSLDVLSQYEISRLEHGKLHPLLDLSLTKMMGLLRGLEWTIHEFEGATGLEVPVFSDDQAQALEAARHLEVHPSVIDFVVHPAGEAGSSAPQPIEGEMASIPTEKLRAAGARKENCVVYQLDADALISVESMRADKSVSHGDMVGVHTHAQPVPGDLVAAWCGDCEKLVVLRYGVERDGTILFGENGMPVTLREVDALGVLGVIIWRCG